MKTLINKNNPQVRITAPEIKEYIGGYEIEQVGALPLFFNIKDWTLVEEEPQLQANLEEAAEEYVENLPTYGEGEDWPGKGQHLWVYNKPDIVETFKAGAEWMAEQIKGGSK